jgi:hypothetical protein
MKQHLKHCIVSVALLFAAVAGAQTQVDPATRINWPRITGAGTPMSLSIACTVANYGQPYQNTAITPNTVYTCGTDGWAVRLPTATATVLGGVKPDNVSILNAVGVLTATPASIGAVSLADTAPQTMAGPLNSPGFSSVSAGSTLTSAIIASVCNGATPGTFILPAGVVYFFTTLTDPTLCTIRGQGMGVSILRLGANTVLSPAAIVNASQSLINPTTLDSYIHFEGFTLDLNVANQTAYTLAMSLSNISYSSFSGVEVNGADVAIACSNMADLTCASYQHDLTFSNDYFHNAGIVLAHDDDSLTLAAQTVKITNSTFGPSTDTGIGSLGFGASGYVMDGNTFINNALACGFAAGPTLNSVPAPPNAQYGTNDIVFTNNHVTCSGTGSFGFQDVLGNGLTLANNIFNDTPISGGTSSATQIAIEAVTNASIANNAIDGSDNQAIIIIAANLDIDKNITVTGNTAKNTNKECFAISSISTTTPGSFLENINVAGNTCIDPGVVTPSAGMVVSQYSIPSSGTAVYQNVTISGNGFLDDRTIPTMTNGVSYAGSPIVSVFGNTVSGNTGAAYSSINSGSASTYTNGTQSADVIQAPTFQLTTNSTTTTLHGYSNLYPGFFSNLTQAGDAGLFFDVNGLINSGALVIAGHSGTSTGLRIDAIANSINYWGGNHVFNGAISTTTSVTTPFLQLTNNSSFQTFFVNESGIGAYFSNSLNGDAIFQTYNNRILLGNAASGKPAVVVDANDNILAPSSVTVPHIIASGTAATLSGTGGTPTCAVGTCLDMRGRLSVPSATTAAVVTFGTAYGAAPVCTVTQNGGATFFIPSWTSTTTALTITTGITLTTGEEFDYACIQ